MKEEKPEKKILNKIPSAIRKTKLVGETKISKRNRETLEMIKAYRGMFG